MLITCPQCHDLFDCREIALGSITNCPFCKAEFSIKGEHLGGDTAKMVPVGGKKIDPSAETVDISEPAKPAFGNLSELSFGDYEIISWVEE